MTPGGVFSRKKSHTAVPATSRQWGRRGGMAALAVLVGAMTGLVAGVTLASANAATPATISGTAVINTTGSVTVTVHGTWTWTTPDGKNTTTTFPCGSGQYGGTGGHYVVGWAMLWTDATDPGIKLSHGGHTYYLGSTNTTNGNVVDGSVHTYSIQFEGTVSTTGTAGKIATVPVGYSAQLSDGMLVYGKKIAATTTIASITTGSALTLNLSKKVTGSTSHAEISVVSALGPPRETTYNNGPDTLTSGHGTATGTTGHTYTGTFDQCGTLSGTLASGTWGPEVHTYKNASTVPKYICVNMYDVHGTMANMAGDYAVTGNPDNSITTNDYSPEGASCFHLKISASVKTTPSVGSGGSYTLGGDGVHDTAVVKGSGQLQPNGSLAFYVCGPLSSASGCSPTASTVKTVATTGTPTSKTTAKTFTSKAFAPTAPGTYCFDAVYTVTATTTHFTSASDGSGSDECFTAVQLTPGFTTTLVSPATTVVGHSWNDSATLTGTAAGGTPGGSVTFTFCHETSGACTGGTTVGTVTAPTSTTATAHSATWALPASDAQTPAVVGSYCYNASYGGAGAYAAVAAETGGPECFAVTAAASSPSSGAGSGSQTPIAGATTVHTGEPWAGSKWLELVGALLALALITVGEILRRRHRRRSPGSGLV